MGSLRMRAQNRSGSTCFDCFFFFYLIRASAKLTRVQALVGRQPLCSEQEETSAGPRRFFSSSFFLSNFTTILVMITSPTSTFTTIVEPRAHGFWGAALELRR